MFKRYDAATKFKNGSRDLDHAHSAVICHLEFNIWYGIAAYYFEDSTLSRSTVKLPRNESCRFLLSFVIPNSQGSIDISYLCAKFEDYLQSFQRYEKTPNCKNVGDLG